MHNPKISIVIPSYNQANFIQNAINSILEQNYNNIQIIIIDGGSSDGTLEIINENIDKIYYWVSEKDKGQSDALNKGFKIADGEILGWLNSDDIYLPNAFKIAIETFANHHNVSVVFGDWLSIDHKGKTLKKDYAFDFNLNHFKYEGSNINAQSMFWKKEIHQKFNGFDVNLEFIMDYQMILEFGINSGEKVFKRVPKILGAFRRYEGQKTESNKSRVIREHKLLANKFGYDNIYTRTFLIKKLSYKLRRAYWYLVRGGFKELIKHI